ncbi:VrrA/YqfQ family protein [Lentibacillus amyloliquefaciens]|uniref:YqfQ-like protein n=1 Tax=Lentibacillus amyloliquefaciens TaxID=1472767 RepID=A0A0U4EX46_9BACI|nr:VrrA/YqfQ family protein [Lentibacillus amyloliquefaciens]ALX47911.1 hypothetical protein AOX59_04410 [Lentibacillus amyloliquefaciens]
MVWPIQHREPDNVMMPRQGFHPEPPQQTTPDLQQFTKGLLTPERINGWSQQLNNVQKVLSVVQQTAPIIQQYGPMIKNLPMLFQLMKALNEDDSETDFEPESLIEDRIKNDNDDHQQHKTDNLEQRIVKTGKSAPKLFI